LHARFRARASLRSDRLGAHRAHETTHPSSMRHP
jgi:hypothetical protein